MKGWEDYANTQEYVIVDFPEESEDGTISMALISSTWVYNDESQLYCYWPTYLKSTLSREKAVRQHLPLALDKCLKCPVEVKYRDPDYNKTLMKLKKLEEEESSSEAERCHRPKKDEDFLYDDSSSDGTYLPKPPKPPKLTLNKPVEKLGKSNLAKSGYSQKSSQVTYDSRMEQGAYSQESSQVTYDSRMEQGAYSQESSQRSHEARSEAGSVSSSLGICQCGKNTSMLERILRDMQTLKLDVKNLVKHANNDKFTDFQNLDSQLSFKKYEDLVMFDVTIGNDADLFNKMQTTLSLLGGRDLNETTRKILCVIMTHQLALNINWVGANEKGSLQKLDNVLKLIYGAVRRNPVCSNSTNVEINNAIRGWIKNAPDREGGRSSRKKKIK